MQLSEPIYEVTAEQAVTRDIAEHYIKIQQNTQYLTNIIRHQHGRVFKLFTFDVQNIQIKSFFNLIVQSSYLLYTCCIKKVALFFSKNLFLAFQKDGYPQIICEFLLEQQYINFPQNKRKIIEQHFNYFNPFKSENAYAENTLALIKSYLGVLKEYNKKQKQNKINQDRICMRQFQGLQNATSLLLSILHKGLKAKTLISCLQETQVFRTYSYLLKTLNCSLYEVIRKTGNFQSFIHQIKRKQMILGERFNLMAQQNAVEYEFLESSLQDFLKYLKLNNLINVQVSVSSGSSSEANRQRSQFKLGTQQIYKNGDRVYHCKILVEEKRMRDFNEKVLLQLTEGDTTTLSSSENQRKSQNMFYIDYMANRGLISVQYISNIEVNIENVDALIYHCNNLMMQLNNVRVQQIERESNKSKRKQKLLSFKLITHLNVKESPFINLMLLIDRVMIYGKVCMPQIAKKTMRIEDYTRFNSVSKRINHLSNLFIKKIRRLYESISVKNRQC